MARRRARPPVSNDLAGRLAVGRESGVDWRTFGAGCPCVGCSSFSRASSRCRDVVYDRIALHAAVPLWSRHFPYRVADGVVGRRPNDLAFLDGNAPCWNCARRLDNRVGALRPAHGEEHDRRTVPLAIHAARRDFAPLLPARCTLDCVPDPARVVCHRVDDLHVHAAADAQ
jgi:hypothetical protein